MREDGDLYVVEAGATQWRAPRIVIAAGSRSGELAAVWEDPEFAPGQRALYYARVLEIPTPRWTAYDRVKFKLDLPKAIPLKTQERAYTSPIWYNPL